MPDTKITALAAITTVDPAADVLPIVDISDTSMAASGTTKKITSNQILGAGGTATLASATITGAANFNGGALAAYLNGSLMFGSSGNTVNFFGQSSGFAFKESTGVNNLLTINTGGFVFGDGAGGTRMTLNATGLGVGNAPVAALDVYKVANDTINRTNATFCFGQITGLGAALLGQQSASAPYQFNLQAANAANSVQFPLVLQPSGGNVGIGVVPNTWTSTFKAIQHPAFTLSSYSTTEAYFSQNAYYDGGWKRVAAGYASQYLAVNSEHRFLTAGTSSAGSAITFTQAMTLDASGRLLVGPTSANTSGGVLQLSSGITFPATQVASSDANTLDDYEEGTFTPAITGTVTAGVGTYSNQIGRYTKVGNQVTVWIRLSWSAHTGSGDMTITGLPFTLANVNNLGAGAAIGYTANISITAGNYLMVYGDSGFARAYFWQTPTGGGSTNTVAVDPSGDIGLTMTYFV